MVLCEKVKGGNLRRHRRETLRRAPTGQLGTWRMGILAKPREQSPQTRGVLRSEGIYFHAKAATIGGDVTYLGFGTNLSLLHEEVKAH